MPTLLTIHVKNLTPTPRKFFIFQKPAIYVGGQKVYTNSAYSQELAPSTPDNEKLLTFQVNMQFHAGLQQAHSTPVVGESSGYETSSVKIDIAPIKGTAADSTKATLDPLGLSNAVFDKDVQKGAFRIYVPPFAPNKHYNVGSAVETGDGSNVLSNFIPAEASVAVDCEPILQFYVATGDYTPGTVMDFTEKGENAALCDFTGGYDVINITMKDNGTWAAPERLSEKASA
ncbi:hypothetical protein [Pseudovibrio sp. Tun.PSC04-5.I4]|uniref:hypothetical protein n=1 Tax=Pseudovibrio sp. Tun.PSC04-5.I4 TaxID=1798213 RepID=UPI00088EB1BC|nr:hypothetical protein [Pseudovibrio sp. Tun.PSC04-5.I4]SDQ16766.1 hypothetical protein SAMN04515695_0285 [Pseudovibrio sp. Tun.PSC04-5.I4]